MYQQDFNLNILLFADDQVLTAKTEDELQHRVNNLQITASECDISIPTRKNKNHGLFR
jgi:hypothetical protein